MNLISDPWIPVIRMDGSLDRIRPCQIVEKMNPVMEINAPRPDFQGALYQFLIGLVQTCFPPEDEDEWLEYWEEIPDVDTLHQAFSTVGQAFELDNPDGPAFMQDYDLPACEKKKIAALLIDAPGDNAIKNNIDHFTKRDQIKQLCPGCTATALFTLQTNAPCGGSGNRVGLRGGGPLTTLLLPNTPASRLWNKIWLNILNTDEFLSSEPVDGRVMPWLTETRLSDKGQTTAPGDAHDLQMYWGMPRRIRIGKSAGKGICDLCGNKATTVYCDYQQKNYGINYDGAWIHPLTPYNFDPKKKKPPLSMKGQLGGLGYQHWLGLVLKDRDSGDCASSTVSFFHNSRSFTLSQEDWAFLWCFGYDMDNMKARCWYDSHFPVLALEDDQKINITDWAGEFIRLARTSVKILRDAVKEAWFSRPKDAKGDMTMIDRRFWQETEPQFYQALHELAALPGSTRIAPPKIYRFWFKTLEKYLFRFFDEITLEAVSEELDMKRIITAKQNLQKKFYNNREIKAFLNRTKEEVKP